jgi:hypothetical protein
MSSNPPTRESLNVDKLDRVTLQRRLIGAAIALVGAIALGGFNAWYINHVEDQSQRENAQVQRESQRELCSFIVAMSEAYRARPVDAAPLSETGERIRLSIEQLRTRYECDKP